MVSRVSLNRQAWEQVKATKGIASDTEAASILGVHQATISRAVNGSRIGSRLVGALWLKWPDDFASLVTVHEEDVAS